MNFPHIPDLSVKNPGSSARLSGKERTMTRAIVVGAGGISRAWFGPLNQEGVAISAVVDLDRAAAEKRVEEQALGDTAVETELGQALERHSADFVVDLTVPAARCEVSCRAMEAGFPVISEKPMAATMEEAHKLVATSERTGSLFVVSQSRRYNPPVLAVRDALAGQRFDALGTVGCDFHLGAHFGGFRAEMEHVLLLDMGVHHFDLARHMAGVDPVAVYCEEFNPPGSWFRHGAAAHAVFEMSGGVRFSYRGSWCNEGAHTSWNGDWRFSTAEASVMYVQDKAEAHVPSSEEGFIRPSEPQPLEMPEPEVKGQHAALREMLQYFQDGTVPQSECHDNIRSFAMVCGAVRSAEQKQRIELETLLTR
jgi:predicted dehydrogenase